MSSKISLPNKIQVDGYSLDLSAGVSNNQVLKYNGEAFTAADESGGGGNQIIVWHAEDSWSSVLEQIPDISTGTGAIVYLVDAVSGYSIDQPTNFDNIQLVGLNDGIANGPYVTFDSGMVITGSSLTMEYVNASVEVPAIFMGGLNGNFSLHIKSGSLTTSLEDGYFGLIGDNFALIIIASDGAYVVGNEQGSPLFAMGNNSTVDIIGTSQASLDQYIVDFVIPVATLALSGYGSGAVDTVIASAQGGLGGFGSTVTFALTGRPQDGYGVIAEQNDNNAVFSYESGVSTVGYVEAAITALSGPELGLIAVQTPGTAGTVLNAPTDDIAQVSLIGPLPFDAFYEIDSTVSLNDSAFGSTPLQDVGGDVQGSSINLPFSVSGSASWSVAPTDQGGFGNPSNVSDAISLSNRGLDIWAFQLNSTSLTQINEFTPPESRNYVSNWFLSTTSATTMTLQMQWIDPIQGTQLMTILNNQSMTPGTLSLAPIFFPVIALFTEANFSGLPNLNDSGVTAGDSLYITNDASQNTGNNIISRDGYYIVESVIDGQNLRVTPATTFPGLRGSLNVSGIADVFIFSGDLSVRRLSAANVTFQTSLPSIILFAQVGQAGAVYLSVNIKGT